MKNKIYFISIFLIFLLFIASNVYAAGVDGTTIVLNPGHGGEWTGCANGKLGLVEKDITLKLANYLKEQLSNYYGVNIILTHDGTNFPNNDAGDLAARAMIARNNNADLYVSLHINDTINKNENGANVYVTSRTELPKYKEGMTILGNKILNNLSTLGIENKGVINNALCKDEDPKYKYYDGSQADYYADIRHAMRGDTIDDLGQDFSDGSGIPTVLIEHCYMNNTHDVQFLDSDGDLKNLAKADADAIIDYLELRLNGTVISDMEIDKQKCNLLVGESTKVNVVSIGPETAQNKNVKWTSSNENIARVDEQGNIVAVRSGTAIISAISEDNPNIIKRVSVNVENLEVKFEKQEENIIVGKTKTLNHVISPSWIENKTILWESSNEDIIEVTQKGIITAKEEGTVTIKLTWQEENISDEIVVNSIKIADDTKIEINQYKTNSDKISNIGPNVNIDEFKSNINLSDNLEVVITPLNDNQEFIGTDTKIQIREKEHGIILEEYRCLVYGDINGDGKIDSYDMYLLRAHMINMQILKGSNLTVANVSKDAENIIDSYDMYLLRAEMINLMKINQE